MALQRRTYSLVVNMNDIFIPDFAQCLEQCFPNPFIYIQQPFISQLIIKLLQVLLTKTKNILLFMNLIPKAYKPGSHSIVVKLCDMAPGL